MHAVSIKQKCPQNDWVSNADNANVEMKAIYCSFVLLNTMILAFSVVIIRKILRSLHNAFPNEKFIGIHVLNSFIYTTFFFVQMVLLVLKDFKQTEVNDEYSIEAATQLEKILFSYEIIYIILVAF